MTQAHNPPINLTDVWQTHKASVLAPRDDGKSLHASDIHSCDYALYQRLRGAPQLPLDDGSFANFERGHAVEARIAETLDAYVRNHHPGHTITHGEQVTHEGIVGHLDFVLRDEKNVPVAVIDVTTTASKLTDWKYGHAIKSAFYAVALGCEAFCEWVFCFGFGGIVTAQQAHWFSISDQSPTTGASWRDLVYASISMKRTLLHTTVAPKAEPPLDPFEGPENWRCGKPGSGKSYCQCKCPRNAAWNPTNDEVSL